MITVKNLVKRYGDFIALDHFHLDIQEKEIFGLLGPNGSGKTTAINCILALLQYDKGSIELFGKPMAPNAYDIKKDIGVIMQNVAVFEELTVYENIDYFCGLYIKDKALRKQYVEEAIAFVSLQEFRNFRPKKLSGGLLRRLNIACGIAHKPKIILLDEPTIAVDPQSRNNILEGIKKLNQQGATIIYTSHYMDEVEYLCDRIGIMDKGKIIAIGTKEELKNMIALGETIEMQLEGCPADVLAQLTTLPFVSECSYQDGKLTLRCTKQEDNVIKLLNFLKQQDLIPHWIHSEQPTLNDVFLEITGKQLRD